MAPNHPKRILADVVDIRNDTPKSDDVFMVDTNVWYFTTYTKASQRSIKYQVSDYPLYIQKAIDAKSVLYYSGLSLSELAHNIEEAEWYIYLAECGLNKDKFSRKVFRHTLPDRRSQVVAEISVAWGQVQTLSENMPYSIDKQAVSNALERIKKEMLDGYDIFILESMKYRVKKILTDDGDFAGVAGLCVFTANRKVIDLARSQGRLISSR